MAKTAARTSWERETEHLNYGKTLKVGDKVDDGLGNIGAITEITPDGEHSVNGEIKVGEKSYPFIRWQNNLRKLPKS